MLTGALPRRGSRSSNMLRSVPLRGVPFSDPFRAISDTCHPIF